MATATAEGFDGDYGRDRIDSAIEEMELYANAEGLYFGAGGLAARGVGRYAQRHGSSYLPPGGPMSGYISPAFNRTVPPVIGPDTTPPPSDHMG